MDSRSYTFELDGSEREDGSTYFRCETLPGFHFVLARGEDIETTLKPALKDFLAMFLSASVKNATPRLHQSIGREHKRRSYRAEFNLAA